MPESDTHFFLLAIETDATRYHGSNAARPRLLSQGDTGQLLAHLSADLASLLPGFESFRLVTVGALFDQTQVLQPGYPLTNGLEQLLQQAAKGPPGSHIALGAENGHIPLESLQPGKDIPLGLLQLLPMLLQGHPDRVRDLATTMEHRFIERGQVSAHTANWLESAFGIRISHARFMTLMDLSAMFRLQLEHFGFLPLWQLLDAALNLRSEPMEVAADSGQIFTWRDGAVHTTYQTFNFWSSTGLGKDVGDYRGNLAGSYADWTRVLRQYSTMLEAHAVTLQFHLPGEADRVLEGSYFIEHSEQDARARSADVTEHSYGELGTVCISVVREGLVDNYYPLRPRGLNDINKVLRLRGPGGGTVAFPGTILFDERTRRLAADTLTASTRE